MYVRDATVSFAATSYCCEYISAKEITH